MTGSIHQKIDRAFKLFLVGLAIVFSIPDALAEEFPALSEGKRVQDPQNQIPGMEPSQIRERWSGTWQTTFGRLSLTVNGNQVEGTYEYRQGRLKGTLSEDGRTLIL